MATIIKQSIARTSVFANSSTNNTFELETTTAEAPLYSVLNSVIKTSETTTTTTTAAPASTSGDEDSVDDNSETQD